MTAGGFREPEWQTRAARQHYRVGEVAFFARMVLHGGASLRGAGRMFSTIGMSLDVDLGQPNWTTGRCWLLRLGLAALLQEKERADDWVWLIDHSAQIGQEKCLVILGVRQAHLPAPGQCLRHEDVRLLHLRVFKDPNQHTVCAELEKTAAQTGPPRAIVNDHGSDVHGGVGLFQQRHPRTIEIYDITHKAACLLKRRLEKNKQWNAFSRQLGLTKIAVLQTELACLAPPYQRTKARYMNVTPLVAWARKTLKVLKRPPSHLLARTSHERLEAKLGWLRNYRGAVKRWSEWMNVITLVESRVRRMGLYVGIAEELRQELQSVARQSSSKQLADELLAFVAAQASLLGANERVPASTEVLESCFGKLKTLEKDQASSGFTAMVLSLGAMVWKTTATIVRQALQSCPVKTVKTWIANNLGATVQAQRCLTYAAA